MSLNFNPMIGVLWLSERRLAIIIPKYHNYLQYLSVFTFCSNEFHYGQSWLINTVQRLRKFIINEIIFTQTTNLNCFVLWTWQKWYGFSRWCLGVNPDQKCLKVAVSISSNGSPSKNPDIKTALVAKNELQLQAKKHH